MCVCPPALPGQQCRPGHCSDDVSYDLTYSIVKTQLGKSLGVKRTRQMKKVLLLRINTFLPRKCIFYNNFVSSGFISFIERSHMCLGREFEIAQVPLGREQRGVH